MPNISGAIEAGRQLGANPFAQAIKRVNEITAEKMALDNKIAEESRGLNKLLLELGKKHEYEKALEEQKGKQERLTELFKGISSGDIEVDDAVAEDILSKFSAKKQPNQISNQAQGVAQISGLSQLPSETSDIPLEKSQIEPSVESQLIPEDLGLGKDISIKKTKTQPVILVDRNTGEMTQQDSETGEMVTVREVPKGAKVLIKTPTLEEQATISEIKSIAKIKPNLDRAKVSINELKKLYTAGDVSKSVKKGDIIGGLGERLRGVKEGITAKVGANPELQQYLKLRKSFASLITKGGFLEAGVLTNQDIERALDALPTTGSTKEEVEISWKVLDEIFSSAEKKLEALLKGDRGKKSEIIDKSQDDEYNEYLKVIGQ